MLLRRSKVHLYFSPFTHRYQAYQQGVVNSRNVSDTIISPRALDSWQTETSVCVFIKAPLVLLACMVRECKRTFFMMGLHGING